MRFDLTDLRLFLNVHEAGTITAGAEASHMTLASASERIRGMEGALGAPLLVRDRRGIRTTPAGRALVHHARLVLSQIERMHNELSDYGAGVRGHVRLLCNTSALSEHLPDVISGFLAKYAGISLDLEERYAVGGHQDDRLVGPLGAPQPGGLRKEHTGHARSRTAAHSIHTCAKARPLTK